MDAMVSARVPIEIKKRGDGKLKEIGSSATELVNAAYRYVIEHGELPGSKTSSPSEQQKMKVLEGDAAEAFKQQWRSRSILEAPAYDGGNFRELLDDARGEYYARFA
jgi:antitoxin component of RelBE/YafQ-DinJ toxin-antitoxin module